jgi:hypothetical protein
MALTRLFVGFRTRTSANTPNAGTHGAPVIIINDNGSDVLHHAILGDTDQEDLEEGQANLYEIPDVVSKDIKPQNLNASSIRVGIRDQLNGEGGEDGWAPEDAFVFGQDGSAPPEGRVVPLALARSITKVLSTDPVDKSPDGEASRISIPIPPVTLGDAGTMQIHSLLALMVTGSDGTDDEVLLRINGSGAGSFETHMPTVPPADGSSQQQQEPGQANFYYFDTGPPFAKNAIGSITLSVNGTDKWKLESFFLFGLDRESTNTPTSPATMIPLVYLPEGVSSPIGAISLPLVL